MLMEIYLSEEKAKKNNISYFGDGPESPEYREDALRCYYEVEKRNNGFFRKQKGY